VQASLKHPYHHARHTSACKYMCMLCCSGMPVRRSNDGPCNMATILGLRHMLVSHAINTLYSQDRWCTAGKCRRLMQAPCRLSITQAKACMRLQGSGLKVSPGTQLTTQLECHSIPWYQQWATGPTHVIIRQWRRHVTMLSHMLNLKSSMLVVVTLLPDLAVSDASGLVHLHWSVLDQAKGYAAGQGGFVDLDASSESAPSYPDHRMQKSQAWPVAPTEQPAAGACAG